MSPPDPAPKLADLLKRLSGEQVPADRWEHDRPEDADPLLWHLTFSFMAWEAGLSCAAAANRRIHESVVDYNELRVCLPAELSPILGCEYPLARERALRLRSTLGDIYRREHRVTLSHLWNLPKRDARLYLESLDGMPLYVAARLSLLSLDAHAFPLDERLRSALVEEQALPPELDVVEATGWLERYFRAGEAAQAYILLEHWHSNRPTSPRDQDPTSRRTSRS